VHEIEEDYIPFEGFLLGLKCLSRSEDSELDHYIFKIFDLCENGTYISRDAMTMMLMNLPDIGFGSGLNTNLTDAQYN